MVHRKQRTTNNESYRTQLLNAIGKFLPKRGLELISSDRRVRWTDRLLVITAILMAWAEQSTLSSAFAFARDFVVRLYPTRRRPGRQLRGFLDSLHRAHDDLLAIVTGALRGAMDRMGLLGRLRDRWMVMGVDGTRIACPRTIENEEAFGLSGKDKAYPQQQLTTLFHVGSGLPWAWRRGMGTCPERTHLRQMIDALLPRTLLLADAGFTGFDLMRTIRQAGDDFIIRTGRNVSLLRKLGYYTREHEGIVYLWPQQQRKTTEPLVLRQVAIRDGRKTMALLTTVLDPRMLPDHAVGELYRQRWGVEVMFRSLKQTMDNHTLRSRSPHHAQMELDWSLVGLWLLGLMTLEAAGRRRTIARGRPWSVAKALLVVRTCVSSRRRKTRMVQKMLAEALVDTYVRTGPKSTRTHRKKKLEPPTGTPALRTATKAETLAAKAFTPYRRAS